MTSTARRLSIMLIAAFCLSSFAIERAAADPPPWAGRWKDHPHDDDDDWRKHHDRDEWRRHRYRHRGADARCGEIIDRIRFNRSKIREIEPTGRHRKALQWYKDDTVNARRDLERCRHGG